MVEGDEKLGLSTLMRGVALERFDDELAKVLANIVDPNTVPTAKREITLKLEVKPDKSRDLGAVSVSVQSKLAPAEKLGTRVFISMTKGGPVATENNPNQLRLPMEPEKKPVDSAQVRVIGGGK